MIYGKITDGKLHVYGRTDGDKWQGVIQYRDGERKTATEMIADNGLLPVITPQDFNGRYGEYNFKNSDGEILILDMKDEFKKANKATQISAQIARLKAQIADIDHRFRNYEYDLKYGKTPSYTEDEIRQFYDEQYAKRTKINELRLML